MIEMTYYDKFTPLLQELQFRTHGLARESLSVGGSIIAKNARKNLESSRHRWQHKVEDGKRKIWKDTSSSRTLGSRTSHSEGDITPHNMSSMIDFIVSETTQSVSIGGVHPDYYPKKYEDGILVKTLPKVKAVGKRTRSILHKLNTGEVSDENPYSKNTMFPNAKYKGRYFMDRALSGSKSEVDKAVAKRYGKSFHSAINNIKVKPVVRQYG